MNNADVAFERSPTFLPIKLCQWCHKECLGGDLESYDEYIAICRDCWFRYVSE